MAQPFYPSYSTSTGDGYGYNERAGRYYSYILQHCHTIERASIFGGIVIVMYYVLNMPVPIVVSHHLNQLDIPPHHHIVEVVAH
jgi:hypothetical protein